MDRAVRVNGEGGEGLVFHHRRIVTFELIKCCIICQLIGWQVDVLS